MIIVYRPDLENPPMDKECTIGFSFVGVNGQSDHIQIKAGVTRDFSEDLWDKIKDYETVKNLLSLGALRIEQDAPEEIRSSAPEAGDSLATMALHDALRLIEESFDLQQLQRWDAKDSRIRVKNAISKRIQAITEGNG